MLKWNKNEGRTVTKIRWKVSRKKRSNVLQKWCELVKLNQSCPTRVVKHYTCKVVWDFNVWTDQVIEAGCLYHIKINKEKAKCRNWDLVITYDSSVALNNCESSPNISRNLGGITKTPREIALDIWDWN